MAGLEPFDEQELSTLAPARPSRPLPIQPRPVSAARTSSTSQRRDEEPGADAHELRALLVGRELREQQRGRSDDGT